jgi:L-ascorbate metabolism protein UlaG (beta-lactamase superfamily)
MRVTKYRQSCLVVEADNGARLLIDPGIHTTKGRELRQLGHLDAVLYTHRHPDHLDLTWVAPLLEAGIRVHGNADVVATIREHAHDIDGLIEVTPGRRFSVADVPVDPYDLPHMPLVDGSEGPPNLGFVLDGRLLHPGDAKDLSGLTAEVLAVPIAGPSLSPRDAYLMVEASQAAVVVPIHHHNFLEDPELFAAQCPIARVLVLGEGETAQL